MTQDRTANVSPIPLIPAADSIQSDEALARPVDARLMTTANWHYAAARRAENAARSLSVRSSVLGFTSAFGDGTTADERANLRSVRDSYYLLVAAHRAAAHRLERGQRLRYRLSVLTYPAHTVLNRVRRFRNERQAVSV